MRGYGSIEPVSLSKRHGSVAAIAAIASVCAVALVVATVWVQHGNGKAVLIESVYKDKWADATPGGDYMECMRCRHSAKQCHPSESEWAGKVPFRTNACPPHKGMQTINVLRKGKVQVEWFDKDALNKGVKAKQPEAKEAAQPEAEPAAEEEQVLCIEPPPGQRAKWDPQQDCAPVMDWLKTLDYGTFPEPSAAEEPEEEEQEEKVPTPIEEWFQGKLEEVEEASGGGGEGGDAKDDKKEEAKPTVAAAPVDLKKLPPDAEDCYGPPSVECALTCMTSCLSAPSGPAILRGYARRQQLFDWSLPVNSFDDTGYDASFTPPLVVPGGNRDFFGINNQMDGGGARR